MKAPNFYSDSLVVASGAEQHDMLLPLTRNRGLGLFSETQVTCISNLRPAAEFWPSLSVRIYSAGGDPNENVYGVQIIIKRCSRIIDPRLWAPIATGYTQGPGGLSFKNLWADQGLALYVPVQGSAAAGSDSHVNALDVIAISGVYYVLD